LGNADIIRWLGSHGLREAIIPRNLKDAGFPAFSNRPSDSITVLLPIRHLIVLQKMSSITESKNCCPSMTGLEAT